MKEIEFWAGSLTYGLSWLHVNTICSRYLRVPVPGVYWWQGCQCPHSRAGSEGVHSSYWALVISFFFFWSGTLYNLRKEQKNPKPWQVCMTLPWDKLEPFLPESFQCKMSQCKPLFQPGPGCVEGLGNHHEKRTVPNEVKDFVPRQRKGLGKFQGNTWLKPLHSCSKLSVICTAETCRYTRTKRKQPDNIVHVLHVGYNPDRTKIGFKRAAPHHSTLSGWGWGWRGDHRFRKAVLKTYLYTWLSCSAEMFCGMVDARTGKQEPLSRTTPFLALLWVLQKLIF